MALSLKGEAEYLDLRTGGTEVERVYLAEKVNILLKKMFY